MRADLDGFTKWIEDSFHDEAKMLECANAFYSIMQAATEFVDMHPEVLVQLPWAGDNFTAAAVYALKTEYDEAIPRRIVELTLDFDKVMNHAAVTSGFEGWAHGVAGGEVHGNASGNVFVAGIEVGEQRHLVAAGEGVGRSTQAFSDINPDAGEFVLYKADHKRVDAIYKDTFKPSTTIRDEVSSLYVHANTEALLLDRVEEASKQVSTTITGASGSKKIVPVKPHYDI
jgi:hypothetical protein